MATPAAQEASAEQPEKDHPVGIRVATVVQGIEAVGITAGAITAAVVTADGSNFQLGNEIGLTLIAFAAACGLAAFTVGLHRIQPWSRTPVFLTQLLVGGIGVFLIDSHRWGWGLAALLLALVCLVGLFSPASFRALNRPPFTPAPDPAPGTPVTASPPKSQQAKPQPAKTPPAKTKQPSSQQAKNQPAKSQPAKSSPARGRPNQNRPAKKAAR
jgi:hypothetical protein